jgi:hypothetical protein
MTHIYRFGAAVRAGDRDLGTLTQIIVNGGIANQLVVNPGLLGIERVMPVSVVATTTADEITLAIDPAEWSSYPALHMHTPLDAPQANGPDLAVMTPSPQIVTAGTDVSHPTNVTGARETEDTVAIDSIKLTDRTEVVVGGDAQRLTGLVVDTGRPQQILIGETAIGCESVTRWDEQRITLDTEGGRPA